jgi:hypothetical protein
VIGVLVIFAFGVLMGNKTSTPEVDIVKIPGKTKTVTKVETVTETVLPESCLNAINEAKLLWEHGSDLYGNGQKQLDIMSKVRLYVGQDKSLNPLYVQQKNLHGEEVEDLQAMSQAQYKFEKAYKECEADR